MGNYREIQGNLINLALEQKFDVIAHGCNCYCVMGAGLAPQMARFFSADFLQMELPNYEGEFSKLGNIDYGAYVFEGELKDGLQGNIVPRIMYKNLLKYTTFEKDHKHVIVVNAYTQFKPGADARLDALSLCMQKINHHFKGKHVGLPLIGCGIGGLKWDDVQQIFKEKLKDCDVTVVHYKP